MQQDRLIDRPHIAAAHVSEDSFRTVLWAAAVFNVVGAIVFAFPDTFGALSGLPGGVPAVYTSMAAMLIALFGGAYAYLARSPVIDRPLLAFGAIGKTCAFLTIFALWLAGGVPFRAVAMITGDLVFAVVFARWLLATGDVR